MIGERIVQFARMLRAAGMAIGPDRVIAALAAVELVGVDRRDDLHAALGAVMLDRHEQQALFDAAFDAFWQGRPDAPAAWAAPAARNRAGPPPGRRLAEALAASGRVAPALADGSAEPPPQPDAAGSSTDLERLRQADFETMSVAEFDAASRIAEQLPPPVEPVRRRRHQAAPGRGWGARIDLRATMLRMARQPQTLQPCWTRPRVEPPAIVALLDVSGSMERYSRLMLHYLHGLTRRSTGVHTLTFGTRLTNITRCLRERDPDVALRLAAAQVLDWRGGTRIAASLDEFNRTWARRLLGSNAAVLLVTDGLDRDPHGGLAAAAAQLRRLAHRVVWLNPLLRYDGFEPKASGVRALLPHVDRFLPVHNLASLADLGRALREPPAPKPVLH